MKQLTMDVGVQECVIYSLAMVLDLEPKEVLSHFPSYYCLRNDGTLRGAHFQEVLDYLLELGYACTLLEDRAFFEDDTEVNFDPARFWDHVANSMGILVGVNPRNNCHAVANYYGQILDPAISKLKIDYFQYWRIDRIRSNTQD